MCIYKDINMHVYMNNKYVINYTSLGEKRQKVERTSLIFKFIIDIFVNAFVLNI